MLNEVKRLLGYRNINVQKPINKISERFKWHVITPYGELRFSLATSKKNGTEVVIRFYKEYKYLGEYGYGFYDSKAEGREELENDIKRLIENQEDANKMYNLTGKYDK